jgi:hypothetical protein
LSVDQKINEQIFCNPRELRRLKQFPFMENSIHASNAFKSMHLNPTMAPETRNSRRRLLVGNVDEFDQFFQNFDISTTNIQQVQQR